MKERQYTASELYFLREYLAGRLEQFSNGVATSARMVAIHPTPGYQKQLQYYRDCVSCINKLLNEVARARPSEGPDNGRLDGGSAGVDRDTRDSGRTDVCAQ